MNNKIEIFRKLTNKSTNDIRPVFIVERQPVQKLPMIVQNLSSQ